MGFALRVIFGRQARVIAADETLFIDEDKFGAVFYFA